MKKPKVREISQVLRINHDDDWCIRKLGPRAGSGVTRDEVRGAIGVRIPKKWKKYIVTFKLSQKGALFVSSDEYRQRETPTIQRFKRVREAYFACFLPNSWIGYRVTRTMKEVI